MRKFTPMNIFSYLLSKYRELVAPSSEVRRLEAWRNIVMKMTEDECCAKIDAWIKNGTLRKADETNKEHESNPVNFLRFKNRFGELEASNGQYIVSYLGRPDWLASFLEPDLVVIGHLVDDWYITERLCSGEIFTIDAEYPEMEWVKFPSLFHCTVYYVGEA